MATTMPQRRGPGGPGGGDDRRGGGAGMGPQGGKKKFFYRRKRVCKFCVEKIEYIDFKDIKSLQQFIPERGKILPRRITGMPAHFHRKITREVKRARQALMML